MRPAPGSPRARAWVGDRVGGCTLAAMFASWLVDLDSDWRRRSYTALGTPASPPHAPHRARIVRKGWGRADWHTPPSSFPSPPSKAAAALLPTLTLRRRCSRLDIITTRPFIVKRCMHPSSCCPALPRTTRFWCRGLALPHYYPSSPPPDDRLHHCCIACEGGQPCRDVESMLGQPTSDDDACADQGGVIARGAIDQPAALQMVTTHLCF